MQPNFSQFVRVLKGEESPRRVHLVEWAVDLEVIEFIMRERFSCKTIPLRSVFGPDESRRDIITFLLNDGERTFIDTLIEFYQRMNYDCFADIVPLIQLVQRVFIPRIRSRHFTDDVAAVSRGRREFAEEGIGIIESSKDLDLFPWEEIQVDLGKYYDYLEKRLPRGMKVMVGGSLFEQVLEYLLGYEGLFFLLHDDPRMVQEIFCRLGELVERIYSSALQHDCVGGIFHADDMGFKTGTLVNPECLKKLLFPWLVKYRTLAHGQGKTFWLHSCGNLSGLWPELIFDVQIDCYHSFQDEIVSVIEFKERFGKLVGVLGGIDIDKMCRLEEKSFRHYVRTVLRSCMPGGRYALGSGNTVTNYISIRNYYAMLDEAAHWQID